MSMPWWKDKDDQLPEALRNMKPEDLVAAVSKAGEVDALKTQLADANTKLSEVDTLKAKIAEMEVNRQPPPPTPPAPTGPTSFLEDENRAFNERLAPFAVSTLQNQARTAKFLAKQTLSGPRLRVWEKYEGEIDEIMKTVDLHFQGSPETWVRALNSVIGNHFDDVTKAAKDGNEFFSETASNTGGGGPQKAEINVEEFTDDDQKIAARFGLTKEQYMASKKEMVVRG